MEGFLRARSPHSPPQRVFTQVVLLMATVAFLPDCHGQLKRRAVATREPRLVWLAKANQAVWRAVGSVLPEPEPILSLETEISQNHGWERVQMAGEGSEGRKPEAVQSPPFRKHR